MWRVGGAHISYQRILIVAVTGIAVFALLLFFNRTSLGRQVRALAADPETARLQGIRMTRMSMMAWALSALLYSHMLAAMDLFGAFMLLYPVAIGSRPLSLRRWAAAG